MDANKFIEVAIVMMVGILMIGIAFTVGLQSAVQMQQSVTASQGNFTGITLYLVQLEPMLLVLIPIVIGFALIYLSYRMARGKN